MIYFAHATTTETVKIGFTAGDPAKRVADLQTACPHRLVILASIQGSEQDEALWHKEFERDRVGGEWFKLTPRLMVRIILAAASKEAAIAALLARVEKLEKQLPAAPREDAWWEQFVSHLAERSPILSQQIRWASVPDFPSDGTLLLFFSLNHRHHAEACASPANRSRIVEAFLKQFEQRISIQVDCETSAGCENLA